MPRTTLPRLLERAPALRAKRHSMPDVLRELSVGLCSALVVAAIVLALAGPRPQPSGWMLLTGLTIVTFFSSFLGSRSYLRRRRDSSDTRVTVGEDIRANDVEVSRVRVDTISPAATTIGRKIRARGTVLVKDVNVSSGATDPDQE